MLYERRHYRKVIGDKLAASIPQHATLHRIGLEWLAAGGHVSIVGEGAAVLLSAGIGKANQYVQKELYVTVKDILQETAAFREYVARTNIVSVMGWL